VFRVLALESLDYMMTVVIFEIVEYYRQEEMIFVMVFCTLLVRLVPSFVFSLVFVIIFLLILTSATTSHGF